MRQLSSLILSVLLMIAGSATAEEDAFFKQQHLIAKKNLQKQAKTLASQEKEVCESNYEKIYAEPEVRISLVYGYLDHDGVTLDGPLSKALSDQLQAPCSGQLTACGFQVEKMVSGHTQIVKKLKVGGDEKTVRISIHAPAVSTNDRDNQDVQKLYFEQREASIKVEDAFYKGIKDSQVVFYNGHAGFAGLYFDARPGLMKVWDHLTKGSHKKFIQNISENQNNLKLMGMFACKTEGIFEKDLLKVAPHLGVITTTENIRMDEGEQALLGALDSILARKCETQFKKSIVSENHPDRNLIHLKNFFEPKPAATTKTSRPATTASSQAK